MRVDTPAAQYLRASTGHQQFSLANQSQAIELYAQEHGFVIVQTYTDHAKSGLDLKHRLSLRQLIKDVVGGNHPYRAILVYDVSRWGRFQDSDEAAHYEFLCKSAGVPVIYCAEMFTNDNGLPNLIMKALKRTMAGEYSRELSTKVFAGLKRITQNGFRTGAMPGYGLRRMLVSADRKPKQQLAFGEYKSIATDRVVYVLGPDSEVACVREIYRLLIEEHKTPCAIARELNLRAVPYLEGRLWSHHAVRSVLSHPKYTGTLVYNRTSRKLNGPNIRLPESQWITVEKVFEQLVDSATFVAAQAELNSRTARQSDERLLNGLRALLTREGRICSALMQSSPDVASPHAFRSRFGSLMRAYELIGYRPHVFGMVTLRNQVKQLREGLMLQIQEMFPGEVSIAGRGERWRTWLQLRSGLKISVRVCRSVPTQSRPRRWALESARKERRQIALIAVLNPENTRYETCYVVPRVNNPGKRIITARGDWLRGGERLTDLARFLKAVDRICRNRAQAPDVTNRP